VGLLVMSETSLYHLHLPFSIISHFFDFAAWVDVKRGLDEAVDEMKA